MDAMSNIDNSVEQSSARIILDYLFRLIHPKKACDLGCGEGFWLQELKARGVVEVMGVDSERYAKSPNWVRNPSEFMVADLRVQRVSCADKMDLAISLETANRLSETRGREFVTDLCNLSDIVLFSAAVPGQNEDDTNPQMQSYWADLFRRNRYILLDCLRPYIWLNNNVSAKYRQNIMLYVRERNLAFYPSLFNYYLKNENHFMCDIVHPSMYVNISHGLKSNSKRNKVLYTYYHSGAFGWIVIHRLMMHSGDDAYLLLTEVSGDPKYKSTIERFVANGLFSGVYTYKFSLGQNKDICPTVESVEKQILTEIDDSFNKQGCNIKSFSNIYSCTDGYDSIGVYFSLKKIAFEYFEFAPDILSSYTEERIRTDPVFNGKPIYRQALLKHKTAYGGSEYQSYVLFPNSKRDRFPIEKCNFFDPNVVACMIRREYRNKILDSFNLEEAPHSEHMTWIFARSSGVFQVYLYPRIPLIKKLYKDWQAYYFASLQTICDYFVPHDTKAVLKPHPSNPIAKDISEKYFLGAYAYDPLLTVPLVGLLPKEYQPECVVLMGESAPKQIGDNVKKIYSEGSWYFSLFSQKHIAVLMILNSLGLVYSDVGRKFGGIGDRGKFYNYNGKLIREDINNLVKIQFPDAPEVCPVEYEIIQINPKMIEESLKKNDLVIYTDVWEDVSGQNIREFCGTANINVIKIKKKPLKKLEDILIPLQNEYIFLISKDNSYAQKLENFNAERKNKAMGIDLIIQSISWEEYLAENCDNK